MGFRADETESLFACGSHCTDQQASLAVKLVELAGITGVAAGDHAGDAVNHPSYFGCVNKE